MQRARAPRFPLRTLLLMLLALGAFVRFWCASHPSRPAAERAPVPAEERGRVVIVPMPRPVTQDAGQH